MRFVQAADQILSQSRGCFMVGLELLFRLLRRFLNACGNLRLEILGLNAQLLCGFFSFCADALQRVVRGRELLLLLLVLQGTFPRKLRRQLMGHLFELRSEPARQFSLERVRCQYLCFPRPCCRFLLNRVDGMRCFTSHFLAKCCVLLFVLFGSDFALGSHRLGRGLVNQGLNLLFCFGQQTGHLPG